MQRKDHKAPFVNIPSKHGILAFDTTSGRECCTAATFSYDINTSPGTDWNTSAARVFIADFQAHYAQLGKSDQEVKEAWISHAESLHRQFRARSRDEAEVQYDDMCHRREERKRQLFSRRRHIAGTLISPRAVELLDALGVHGMSSDESDHEAGRGEATYIIPAKQWRSPELQTWLRTLDSLHLFVRYRGGFKASQGGWPHFRVSSRNVSSAPAVTGLPVNCYAPSILKEYDSFKMKWLSPISKVIDLTHSDRIME
ncbi:uncharacterized protein C8Q71DRAFT_701912 [Rhodofomes roseus]|uniref:Uncharacterized protein n=1 Tax=Rhodofomes roseus TaxID=34475 RepID=A0ABQ8KQM8_9APHY|nr:uncharacterized protein C8Q71DRAFT_701912 [Rhodofomes roseus]KAH9840938.1 hypothetical protein C8Q71DRAFT_701912 [Rhodofomes roseus]